MGGGPIIAPPAAPATRRRGFTLVELVIVVMILGILAGVAAPKLIGFSTESQAAAILTNVDIIFDAAERFAAVNGRWPEDAETGDFPADLEGYLRESLFTERSPLVGPYDWNGPGAGMPTYGVSIGVVGGADPEDRDIYKLMETLADDGSPSTGWITVEDRSIVFTLAEKPAEDASDEATVKTPPG